MIHDPVLLHIVEVIGCLMMPAACLLMAWVGGEFKRDA